MLISNSVCKYFHKFKLSLLGKFAPAQRSYLTHHFTRLFTKFLAIFATGLVKQMQTNKKLEQNKNTIIDKSL